MPMTPAERAKKYRDSLKNDPSRHLQYLDKERRRYKKRKEKGYYDISQRSEREKNLIKRKWKIQKREQRKRQQQVKVGIEFANNNTPVSSPVRYNHEQQIADNEIVQEVSQKNRPVSPIQKRNTTHQVASGKKRRRRAHAKTYRKIDKLEKEKNRYKTLWERSRKGLQRAKQRIEKEEKKRCKKSHNDKHTTVRRIFKRTGHSVTWNIEKRRQVRIFLEEDINSVQAPGKKDTITKAKIKKQKRYLCDTLLNLFKKFVQESPEHRISYATFCRFRPFWIVQRKSDARETCLCKLHENVKYRVEKLYRLKIIEDSNPDNLVNQLMCDTKGKECAYRECSLCRDKKLAVASTVLSERGGEQAQYEQWITRSENYESKDGTKTIQKTVKVTEQDTVETLLDGTQTLLKDKYVKHIFNIKHQYVTLKQVKENLDTSTAIVYVDFSENYTGKLASEIQSMHFGGSHKQVSLHTVVIYLKDNIKSFCTVSDNTYHGPGAIWAHLTPVLQYIKSSYPDIYTIHFVSDGPCTQYRSKNHFFMFHRHILNNFEFEIATWNFTESGHGKSAADGIGGTVKRTADRLVATGIDIPDAKAFYDHVGKHLENVQLFFIESDEIERLNKTVPRDLKTLKGTMKLHQIIISKRHSGKMLLKELSCFCSWPTACDCYTGDVSEHTYPVEVGIDETPVTWDQPSSEVTKDTSAVDPNPDMVGTWCVIKYEGEAYPGIIQDIDDMSAEVKCMCRIGENRFFWPLIEDVIWYNWSDVIMNIPEPRPVTSSRGSRHVQIEQEVWKRIREKLSD